MADTAERTTVFGHELAERIAHDICTNGAGVTANRIMLKDGRDGGGRSYVNLVDTIRATLAAVFMEAKP